MTSRRSFLGFLTLAPLARVLGFKGPAKPRWNMFPAQEKFFKGGLNESAVVAAELERVRAIVPVLFQRDSVFFMNLDQKNLYETDARQSVGTRRRKGRGNRKRGRRG